MATKAQKRLEAQKKHEAFMEELRLSGLEAQRQDRADREHNHRKMWEKKHEKHFKFDNSCPHCQDVKKHQKSVYSGG